mmetsp:Transcript_39280/g.90479  ORF Transcript_39280/g.90479 Transcript_39280/m.90479 type:complete len:254 (-) Transcript_39280:1146-1907(-)
MGGTAGNDLRLARDLTDWHGRTQLVRLPHELDELVVLPHAQPLWLIHQSFGHPRRRCDRLRRSCAQPVRGATDCGRRRLLALSGNGHSVLHNEAESRETILCTRHSHCRAHLGIIEWDRPRRGPVFQISHKMFNEDREVLFGLQDRGAVISCGELRQRRDEEDEGLRAAREARDSNTAATEATKAVVEASKRLGFDLNRKAFPRHVVGRDGGGLHLAGNGVLEYEGITALVRMARNFVQGWKRYVIRLQRGDG